MAVKMSYMIVSSEITVVSGSGSGGGVAPESRPRRGEQAPAVGRFMAALAASPEHPQSMHQELLYLRAKMHHMFHP
jgi:hypothetical protein